MTDREEFEKFLKDNFLYDTSGFIQNEAERKKAQDESFVWRAWQSRGELDAVKIKELESDLDDRKREVNLRCGQIQERDKRIAELTARIEKDREYALSIKKNLERLWEIEKSQELNK